MFKKSFYLVLLACILFPLTARAASWTLNTWVKTGGGSIIVRGVSQTSANGSVFKSYTTSANVTVTVSPSTGYQISSVNLNGVTTSNPTQTIYPVHGPSSQNVYASFSAQLLSITASAGYGGSVSPGSVGGIYYGQKPSTPIKFTFSPSAGFAVTAISGVPAGATVSPALPASFNTNVTVTIPTTFTFTSNIALAGTFTGSAVAYAGPMQTVLTGTSAMLDGTGSTGTVTSWAWSQTSGPGFPAVKVIPDNSPGSRVSFVPPVAGTYTFSLTVNGSSMSFTTMVVTDDLALAARNQCLNCHVTSNVGTATQVFSNWSSSPHLGHQVICYNCHVGTNTGGHPGTLISGSVDEQSFTYATGGAIFCQNCHTPGEIHHTAGMTCARCHNSGEIHNPTATFNALTTVCQSCHVATGSVHYSAANAQALGDLCSRCHGGHSKVKAGYPHFSSFTTAQYVTAHISCDNCHTAVDETGASSFNVYSANRQWARSGKGDGTAKAYVAYDFKTLGTAAPASLTTSAATDCVRCHTTTGYVNYVSSNFQNIAPWGTSGLVPGGDRTREMIACSACHDPTPFISFDSEATDDWGNPLQPAFKRRVVPQVTAYYNYSAPGVARILNKAVIQDEGESNNCIVCHTGTLAGSTLKALATKVGGAAASFWGNTPFVATHGMGAAGVLFSQSGYTYATKGRSYSYPGFVHFAIDDGSAGGQGPCIACHLFTDKPHLFSPISSARNGVITKVTAYDQVCSICHIVGNLAPLDLGDPANLQAKKDGFNASLKALAAALAVKGINYNPDLAPYYFTTGDSAQQGSATVYRNWNAFYSAAKPTVYTGSDVMGAAFNLRLLGTESGAYAHNSYYTRRLIYDSIDCIDDGTANSSVYVTIQNLPVTTSFTANDKAKALSYVGLRP